MQSRIELWTNDWENEFAIIAKSKVLAKTAETDFTKSIDKSSFDKNRIYNWDLMINRWITFYYSNKYTANLAHEGSFAEIEFVPVGSLYKRIRPKIKCSFCGLKFYGIDDRQEHEMIWHPRKFVNAK
jgi:hypothetical protein